MIKKIFKYFFAFLLIFMPIASIYVYNMPLEKAILLKTYQIHLDDQQIDLSEIVSQKIFKELNNSSSALYIQYKNDPLTYRFIYCSDSFDSGKLTIEIFDRNVSINTYTSNLITPAHFKGFNKNTHTVLNYSPKDYFMDMWQSNLSQHSFLNRHFLISLNLITI